MKQVGVADRAHNLLSEASERAAVFSSLKLSRC